MKTQTVESKSDMNNNIYSNPKLGHLRPFNPEATDVSVTDSRTLASEHVTNTIRVAIIETDVLGAKAYHAKCLNCDWETRRFDLQKAAVALAKRHVRHTQAVNALIPKMPRRAAIDILQGN